MTLQGNGVVTLGETMALLSPPPAPRLRDGAGMTLGMGGAESNVAIALARLGCPVTWISRVGDDDFGALVVRELRAEGVTVRAEYDPVHPTGLMVKEARGGRTTRVRYYRSGSAASRMTPGFAKQHADEIAAAAVLHVTGITPALGMGPREALLEAIELARQHRTLVSFDVNHRATLWSTQEAQSALVELAQRSDLTFAGPEEAALLLGAEVTPIESFEAGEKLARRLADLIEGRVVLKLGHLGAIALDGDTAHHGLTRPVVVTDAVGAGDAFVGGYLAALLDRGDVPQCLALANRLGGAVCQAPGDWEALPTRAELDALDGPTDVLR